VLRHVYRRHSFCGRTIAPCYWLVDNVMYIRAWYWLVGNVMYIRACYWLVGNVMYIRACYWLVGNVIYFRGPQLLIRNSEIRKALKLEGFDLRDS
jgi:hypothetical protein